jgi:DNA-directed RNA polymerase specialized sigma24 family protein
VSAALEGLSDGAWLKLKRYAEWRVRGVPRSHREARDGTDLLGAAIEKTLEGCRRWHRRHDLVEHLIDTMGSIANHWKEKAAPDSAIVASDLTVVAEDGTETNPLMTAVANAASPERSMVAKDLVERIEALFANDPLQRDVLAGMMAGFSQAEIAAVLGVDELRVNAVARKIQRRARAIFPEGKDI